MDLRRTPLEPWEALRGARACRKNSLCLLKESAQLLEHEFSVRAMFLAGTAIEEMAKAVMLLCAIRPSELVDWGRFWKAFRNHASKMTLQVALTVIDMEPEIADAAGLLFSFRELALYVDFLDDNIIHDPSVLTHVARECVAAARKISDSYAWFDDLADEQILSATETPWYGVPDTSAFADIRVRLTRYLRRKGQLRDINPDRVIRAFERAGYAISRVAGSHYVLKHPERRTVIIPRHRVVKVGLLVDQIKAAELTIEEFEELL